MPWKNTNMEDMRLNFILSVLAKEGYFTEICSAFGISPKTGYKWLNRYNEEGKEGLKNKSRKPHNRPRDTPLKLESAIIAKKLRHPRWGPKKIRTVLIKDAPNKSWPSETTVANILKRNGYVSKAYKREKLALTAPLEECKTSNDVWSADFKGWWKVLDGNICQPFTLLDTHSRFLFTCQHSQSTSITSVQPILTEIFQEFGMPRRFRSDNGPPFATKSVGRLSRLSIWLIKLGVTPEWITPGKPQENGIHERMHRTLKEEISRTKEENLKEQDKSLAHFQYEYNFIRPHEALALETPSNVYRPSNRKWTGEIKDPIYNDTYETRIVNKRGAVSWKGIRFFTSEILYGELVGIKQRNQVYEVYFGPVLLGRIDPVFGYKRV